MKGLQLVNAEGPGGPVRTGPAQGVERIRSSPSADGCLQARALWPPRLSCPQTTKYNTTASAAAAATTTTTTTTTTTITTTTTTTTNNNNNNNDDDHDDDNDDDDNNNDNCIQRRNSSFLTVSSLRRELSPTRTLKWPNHNRVKITCNTSGAYHVQRIVCHLVRRNSSALKFDRVEIAYT